MIHSRQEASPSYTFAHICTTFSDCIGTLFSMFNFIPQGFEQHHDLQWIGGKVPLDVPICGYRGEKCQFKPSNYFNKYLIFD